VFTHKIVTVASCTAYSEIQQKKALLICPVLQNKPGMSATLMNAVTGITMWWHIKLPEEQQRQWITTSARSSSTIQKQNTSITCFTNKKSELMLMRHAKAYSSSCPQAISVYLHQFCRNSLFCSQKSPKTH